jgi:hypothetical protein
MDREKNSYIIILSFFCLSYIFFTNAHFNYEETLIFGGADGESYLNISKYSPGISKINIQPIHSERFIFPYIIGLIANIFSLDIFLLYKILSISLLFAINFIFIQIANKINFSLAKIVLCLCLINFNPYITRFYISNPLILVDLFFYIGLLITILGVIEKKNFHLLSGLLIAISARQTAAAILISILLVDLVNKNFLKKVKINLILIITFIIIVFFNFYYSNQTLSYKGERASQYFITLFGLFMENKNLFEIFHFLVLLPLLSFGPLIAVCIFTVRKIKYNSKIKDLNIFLLSSCVLIILQPFLSGIDVTGRNVMRLTTLGYIPLLIFLFSHIQLSKNFLKYKTIFIIVILFIWSSHPTLSIFSFLETFKF